MVLFAPALLLYACVLCVFPRLNLLLLTSYLPPHTYRTPSSCLDCGIYGFKYEDNIKLAVKEHACICFEVVQDESSGELL